LSDIKQLNITIIKKNTKKPKHPENKSMLTYTTTKVNETKG